jgi:hypothetical protein
MLDYLGSSMQSQKGRYLATGCEVRRDHELRRPLEAEMDLPPAASRRSAVLTTYLHFSSVKLTLQLCPRKCKEIDLCCFNKKLK